MTSEPVYQTRWSHPETVWGDVSKDVYDKYETFGYVERRIVYTHRDPIASAEEAVPDVWRTKEFVMSRLIEAAKEPPSSRSVGNSGRPVGDVWRMVLLSDLQEVVHHLKDEATHPAAAQPSRAEVLTDEQIRGVVHLARQQWQHQWSYTVDDIIARTLPDAAQPDAEQP